jgi:hypothetical protein
MKIMKTRIFKRRRDGVSQHYRMRIDRKTRAVFNQMSNSNKHDTEFGGVIHVNKDGKLKELTVIPGKCREVDLPDGNAFKWHTHPSDGFDPPSPTDVMALLADDDQHAEIVFNNGMSISVLKTPDLKDFLKNNKSEQEAIIKKAFYESNTPVEYKRNLEKLGFYVQINKKLNKPIILEAKI